MTTERKELLPGIYRAFQTATLAELETRLALAGAREEKVFYRELINLKLQLAQEKIVGEMLL